MRPVDPILPFLKSGMKGAEIGVKVAKSSIAILEQGCELLCVDPWEEYEGYLEKYDHKGTKALALERLKPYIDRGKAKVFEGLSEQAAETVEDGSLDFVFIDGNHSYEYVLNDCRVWWPKLKVGGFLTGHDYNLNRPPTHEVKRAVDAFGRATEQHDTCWLVRKPEEKKLKHLIITRGRIGDKKLRDNYYEMAREWLAPGIKSQTDKDFEFCLMCYPDDAKVFEEITGIKGRYFQNIHQVNAYGKDADIQTRHDIDDWMAPGYVAAIHKAWRENKAKHKNFLVQAQPTKIENGEEKGMSPYHATRTSMFLSSCRGDGGQMVSVYKIAHGQMWQAVPVVIDLPGGLVKWVRHPQAASVIRSQKGYTDNAILGRHGWKPK